MHGARAGGFALISVLWVTGLMAVIALSFVSSSRTEGRLARNLAENAKAEALADGGVHRAVLGLLEQRPRRAWHANGRPRRLVLGDGAVRITVMDEDAKVDLNAAPPELLAGLLTALGVAEESALALADRIVDFRDADDTPQPAGAEDPDYAAAGLAHGAKDGAFATERELLRVLGLNRRLFEQMRPHVTVRSGVEGVDPLRASRLVLRAIPGMTEELIEAFGKGDENDDPFALLDDDEAAFDLEVYLIPSRDVMYNVRADARTVGGGRYVRDAVIELTGDVEAPFLVHVWQRGTLE